MKWCQIQPYRWPNLVVVLQLQSAQETLLQLIDLICSVNRILSSITGLKALRLWLDWGKAIRKFRVVLAPELKPLWIVVWTRPSSQSWVSPSSHNHFSSTFWKSSLTETVIKTAGAARVLGCYTKWFPPGSKDLMLESVWLLRLPPSRQNSSACESEWRSSRHVGADWRLSECHVAWFSSYLDILMQNYHNERQIKPLCCAFTYFFGVFKCILNLEFVGILPAGFVKF